jgi:ABC-2 type transport system permease protein
MTSVIKPDKLSYNKLWVVFATVKMRLINISRYRGNLILDAIIPIVVASMPILLGRATAGAQAGAAFAVNSGTTNYVTYMLIGAVTFDVVSTSFWLVAFWLRREMESGTLEALYLTPTDRFWIVAGVALYGLSRSALSGTVAYFLGSWIYGVSPFQGNIGIALLFIVAGIIPLYGMTLMFGALILRLKEANSLVNVMQWGVSFLMGVFFPLTAMPAAVRYFAMIFPPTWMTNGVRSAMLGVGYFFKEWYFDLAVLGVFLMIGPLLGYTVFRRTEDSVRRNEGVGKF